MNRTPLYERHLASGAKMADFHGWALPLHYGSSLKEHRAVRSSIGLFDVSHMGHLELMGREATAFCDWIATNELASKKSGKAIYTLLCNEEGRCVDDAIFFKHSSDHYSLIVNGARRQQVLSHLQQQLLSWPNVELFDHYEGEGMVALQGPHVLSLIAQLLPDMTALPPMECVQFNWRGEKLLFASTGYTGEAGCEVVASSSLIQQLWDELFFRHQELQPCGLVARDSLRLEAGFALYGQELSEELYGCDTISSWTIGWNKENFLGKEALCSRRKAQQRLYPVALLLQEKAIPRSHDPLFSSGEQIGAVTSGGFSPTLEKGIALAFIDRKLEKGDLCQLQQRGRLFQMEVVSLPFYSSHRPGKEKT